MGDDVQYISAGHLPHGGAEVLQGDAQFVGIELRAAFAGIVFDDELHQFAAYFLFPALVPFLHLRTVAIHSVYAAEEHAQSALCHFGVRRIGTGRDACP